MKKEDLNIIEYGVDVFSFLIRRKGIFTGKEFADIIRRCYDNEKAALTANLIEKYISKISADMKGTKYIYK